MSVSPFDPAAPAPGWPAKIPELTESQAIHFLKNGLGHSEYAVSKVLLTEDLCRALLERNTNNRPMRMNQVHSLVSVINRQEWRLTQQGIAVRADGLLGDGQHRVMAARLAQRPIPVFLWWNMGNDVMDVIDVGIRRTIGDVFGLAGVDYAPQVASAARLLLRYREDMWSGKQGGTNVQVIGAYNREPLIADYVSHGKEIARGTGVAHSVATLAAYLFHQADLSPATTKLDPDAWIEQLVSGENLTRDMPAYQFRQLVQSWNQRKIRVSQRSQLLALGKAWIAWVRGGVAPQLRARETDGMVKIERPFER